MIIRYKGASSSPVPLPGGGPQGTLLGLLLFLVLIDDVGFDGQSIDVGDVITSKKKLKDFNEIHLKYVDDLLIAEAVNMKEQLETVPSQNRPLPDAYHARTGHCLPLEQSKVHSQLLKTKKYAIDNEMQLNLKKTKLMLFNPGRIRDFMPNFSMDGKEIELVEEHKLLGVVLRSDLSWESHVDYIVGILKFAAPVWHPSITGELRLKLRRVQKSAFHIILSDKYTSYRAARKELCLNTLHARRQSLCKKFAKKSFKHQKFSKWFKLNEKKTKTRHKQPKLCNVVCRTSRFQKSPISYLTNILNKLAD